MGSAIPLSGALDRYGRDAMTDPRLTACPVRRRAVTSRTANPSRLVGWTPAFVVLLAALAGVGCGGGVPVEDCATGTYDHDDDAATACVAWTVCRAGEYVGAAGTADTDRECAACDAGEYATTINAASCSAWTGCVAGEYVSAAGTAASDQVCTGCTSGTFAAGADAAACVAWTECVAGTYVRLSTTYQAENPDGLRGV